MKMGRRRSTQLKERMKSMRKANIKKVIINYDELEIEDKIKTLKGYVGLCESDLNSDSFRGNQAITNKKNILLQQIKELEEQKKKLQDAQQINKVESKDCSSKDNNLITKPFNHGQRENSEKLLFDGKDKSSFLPATEQTADTHSQQQQIGVGSTPEGTTIADSPNGPIHQKGTLAQDIDLNEEKKNAENN